MLVHEMSQEVRKQEEVQEAPLVVEDILSFLQPEGLRDPCREPTHALSSKMYVALWVLLYAVGVFVFLHRSPLERLWMFVLLLSTLWVFLEAVADLLPRDWRQLAGSMRVVGHSCGAIGILSYLGMVLWNLVLGS